MNHITRNPLRLFFLVNMFAGLVVLTIALLTGAAGADSLRAVEQWQAGGTQFRVALAALLYILFAWYADLYFRPLPNRKM